LISFISPQFNFSSLKDYIRNLVALKSSNPNLKIAMALGGGGDSELIPVWSSVAANADARSNLASNILQFLQTNNLDGVGEIPEFVGFLISFSRMVFFRH
jgi:GH18 family chitinase